MAAQGKTVSYKLVLLGDAAVGKSSCVGRFVKNEFLDFQQPTIGAAFLTQNVKLDSHTVKFEIWDTAGQERYRSLAPMYYRGAGAALVLYDMTEPETFEGAKTWIEELQRQGSPDIVIALAGNKCDLTDNRKVPFESGEKYAREAGCIFFETSAKTGENIAEVFAAIAKKLPSTPKPSGDDNITIISTGKKEGKCCSS